MKKLNKILIFLGIDLKKLTSFVFFPSFFISLLIFISKGGKINKILPYLTDKNKSSATLPKHYFYQDLLVSNTIFKSQPKNHLDIGSRIDGFVASVAAYMKIDVLDIRDLKINFNNIVFIKSDLLNFTPKNKYESISCLHTIEHIGLGRYGDKIDPNGYLHALIKISKILEKNGTLYLSVPVAREQKVVFNAHRIFKPSVLVNTIHEKTSLKLDKFILIDDHEKILTKENLTVDCKYGCGIFIFNQS